jgi:hypothetical protein
VQVLVRDAELHQLPIKPRDIVIPLLKGCLRPLESGALLLEPTLCLFPRQVFPLEGSWASTRAARSSWSWSSVY